jgi:regulator of protease activity HflC (stomatin/prohibitin superfamily)
MVIGIILALVFVAVAIGSAIYAYKQFEYSNGGKKGVLAAVLCLLMVACFIFIPWSFYTVDQSEVAVVKSLGKIKDTRDAGTYFDFWVFNSHTKYSTKVQEVNLDDMAYSSDAQQMTLSIKFQYQIMADKVKEITTQYGNLKTLEARITPTVRDKVKGVCSSLTAMEIIAQREVLSGMAFEAVREALGNGYYVNITSVAITNIDFSDQFETAVEEKMIAEQNALKAEYENEAKVAKAEADAKAKLVSAEAEAKANELLENSVTDKILQKIYLEKWDGVLPNVVAGDDVSMILPSYSDK